MLFQVTKTTDNVNSFITCLIIFSKGPKVIGSKPPYFYQIGMHADKASKKNEVFFTENSLAVHLNGFPLMTEYPMFVFPSLYFQTKHF